MPKILYKERAFGAEGELVIARANAIIAEYAAQGFDLTLRQLYYQFVSRNFLRNRDTEYKRLGSIVNDARLAGRIDWDAIVDRTRNLRRQATWTTPAEIIDAVARQYRNDLWRSQALRIEVWIEKDALVGVIEGICNRYGIPHFSCRGYTSQSEMWGAAQRVGAYIEAGQRVLILHLGDHDPSGMDMTRDIRERMTDFLIRDYHNAHVDELGLETTRGRIHESMDYRCQMRADESWSEGDRPSDDMQPAFEVRRIALNFDQVEQYQPPPNPAKLSDSRSTGYIDEFGDESWELDALDPTTLAALIENEVLTELDTDAWDAAQAAQDVGTRLLRTTSSRWNDVVALLEPAP